MASKRKSSKRASHEERSYTVRGIRREPLDIRKLSKALIGLVMAEAEREAEARHVSEDNSAATPAANKVSGDKADE